MTGRMVMAYHDHPTNKKGIFFIVAITSALMMTMSSMAARAWIMEISDGRG